MSIDIIHSSGHPERERRACVFIERTIDEWPTLIALRPEPQLQLLGVLVVLGDRDLLAVISEDEGPEFVDAIIKDNEKSFKDLVRQEMHDLIVTKPDGLWRMLVLWDEKISETASNKHVARLRLQLGKGPLA